MNERHSYVLIGEQKYLVSTTFSSDRGWETMVFETNNKTVENWEAVFYINNWYDSADEAMSEHAFVVKILKELFKNN